MDDQTATGSVGIIDSIDNMAVDAVHMVENAGSTVLHTIEAAPAAIVAEVETIVQKVEKFFSTTNSAHLQDALTAIGQAIDDIGARLKKLESFTLGK